MIKNGLVFKYIAQYYEANKIPKIFHKSELEKYIFDYIKSRDSYELLKIVDDLINQI